LSDAFLKMYLSGKTMADIRHFLNDNGVKTSYGNAYNKDSIRRILTNRKYLGIYIYGNIEIPDGIPRIVSDEAFKDAQILLEKNKTAPGRAKAVEENYLLTTKLFCGHCQCALTGMSGKSGTGKIHQYYSCVSQRQHKGCNKKNVQKVYIENAVIDGVLSILNDDYISNIAQRIADLSAKESNTSTLTRLKKLLKENETATANLVKAIESGKAVDVLSAQIEKRQAERTDLEIELAKEKMVRPVLAFDEVKFFFEKFKNGDVSDNSFRTSLIDTLVGQVYIFEGDNARLEIYCNATEHKLNCSIDERKSSSMEQLAAKR